jgi:thiol:disulfide interchange protein DsbC
MRVPSLLFASLFLATACSAGDADIQANLEARFPGAKVKTITASPIAGVYEVVMDDNQIIYSDGKADYIMVGEILDAKTRKSLTREKQDELNKIAFGDLPLDKAVKIVKGDGSRKIAVFSDPDCPYCKKLENELVKLDNITVYTFMYPLPMHSDAPRKSRLVWCSADRAKAWNDLMQKGKVPEGKGDCANPIEANLELGQKLGIQGTPAIILADGKRIPGYMPAAQLDARINQASGTGAK